MGNQSFYFIFLSNYIVTISLQLVCSMILYSSFFSISAGANNWDLCVDKWPVNIINYFLIPGESIFRWMNNNIFWLYLIILFSIYTLYLI